jgi:hypothetical protein
MEVRNVHKEDILAALDEVNKRFSDNIRIKDMRMLRKHTRIGAGEVWAVTLTVQRTSIKIVDNEKPRRVHIETLPGVKIGRGPFSEGRRLAAACWHAHGYFIDALPRDCIILSGTRTFDGKPNMRRPGESWKDFPVGSTYYPVNASQCCNCAE